MADANDLVRVIKQASGDACEAGCPVWIMAGTVTSARPLTVKIEQRFSIGSTELIVPEYLTDHTVELSVTGVTQAAGEPERPHTYGGTQTVKLRNGLKTGDHVILLRQQGGQKFLVLDRVVKQ